MEKPVIPETTGMDQFFSESTPDPQAPKWEEAPLSDAAFMKDEGAAAETTPAEGDTDTASETVKPDAGQAASPETSATTPGETPVAQASAAGLNEAQLDAIVQQRVEAALAKAGVKETAKPVEKPSFKVDLTKSKGWDNLSPEAQETMQQIADQQAEQMAKLHEQMASQSQQAQMVAVAQRDHSAIESALANPPEDLKTAVANYTGNSQSAFTAREQVRQAFYAIAPSLPRSANVNNVIQGIVRMLAGEATQQPQKPAGISKETQDKTKEQHRMVAQHAVGPGSNRRSNGVAGKGRRAATDAVGQIITNRV